MVEIIGWVASNVTRCQSCDAELKYEKGDVGVGEFGCAYVECPVCNNRAYLETEKYNQHLTHQNLKYPQHFAKYGRGKKLSDDEVRQYITEVSKSLLNGSVPIGEFTVAGTGDTLVIGLRYGDGDEIIVTKGRETVTIPPAEEQTNL